MTTGVDRSTLPLMGRKPTEFTLSIDDGVPYFPGITTLAESPRKKGLLFVGTDDGRFRVSRDGGATWDDQQTRFPGLPKDSWFAGAEPSHIFHGAEEALDDVAHSIKVSVMGYWISCVAL